MGNFVTGSAIAASSNSTHNFISRRIPFTGIDAHQASELAANAI
jgi:hypothetical protein